MRNLLVSVLWLWAGLLPAQTVVVTDTVALCTGESWQGIVFGRDSLVVTDTLASGDTLLATQVRTLPVYLLIRDTTLWPGTWFLGEPRYNNIAVDEVGTTYLGCDSNITWVLFYRKDADPPDNLDWLKWKFRAFPTVFAQQHIRIELTAQTPEQAVNRPIDAFLTDAQGRVYNLDYDPLIENWTVSGTIYQTTINTDALPSGWFLLTVYIGQQTFRTPLIKLK